MSASERAAAASSAYRQAYGGSDLAAARAALAEPGDNIPFDQLKRELDLDVPPAVLPYLATLRRLPDEVVLDMASRNLILGTPEHCMCGWAVRLALGEAGQLDVAYPTPLGPSWDIIAMLVREYGGDTGEWADIYWGVTDARMPDIELAFLLRVAEAAE